MHTTFPATEMKKKRTGTPIRVPGGKGLGGRRSGILQPETGRIVAVKLNAREAGAERSQGRDQRRVGNCQVQMKLDAGGGREAPHHFDCIIILTMRLQLRARSRGEALEMQVCGLGIVIVIQVRGVNVQKRRLRKTPQEHRHTEDGTRYSHRLHTLSAVRKIVKRTQPVHPQSVYPYKYTSPLRNLALRTNNLALQICAPL